jgi:hypothetical protein
MFKLKPTKRFRKQRIKACANCKHLNPLDETGVYKCARPSRARGGIKPIWHNNWRFHWDDLYSYVCDRWTAK